MKWSIKVGDLVYIEEGKKKGEYIVKKISTKKVKEKSLIGLKIRKKIIYYREYELRKPTKIEIKKYTIKNMFNKQ